MNSNTRSESSNEMEKCLAIVDAVAKRKGVSATSLQPPLYDAVDPDALETLLTTEKSMSHSQLKIHFEYAGYNIVVDSDSGIKIE